MPILRKNMTKKKCIHCYKKTRKNRDYNIKKLEKLKLVVFDMDGVITDTLSSWKYVHDYFNTSNEKSVEEYIQGKIDDMEFIRRDANLWKENGKSITQKRLEELLKDVPLMKGAEECIKHLKENKIKTAIVSAGINVLADNVAKKLRIKDVLANGVKTDNNGYLNGIGILNVKLMYKDIAIKNLAKKSNINLENIVAVGNSCFDIPMFEVSGLGIAFNPEDECTKKAADFVVLEKDLRKILPYIKK